MLPILSIQPELVLLNVGILILMLMLMNHLEDNIISPSIQIFTTRIRVRVRVRVSIATSFSGTGVHLMCPIWHGL